MKLQRCFVDSVLVMGLVVGGLAVDCWAADDAPPACPPPPLPPAPAVEPAPPAPVPPAAAVPMPEPAPAAAKTPEGKIIQDVAEAVKNLSHLRAEFTQIEYDELFDPKHVKPEMRKGQVAALVRSKEGKHDLGRNSYLTKKVGDNWLERPRHYWVDPDNARKGYEFNPTAMTLKEAALPERTDNLNPTNSLETALVFLKNPQALDKLYTAAVEPNPNPAIPGTEVLRYTPKPVPAEAGEAAQEANTAKFNKIIMWIDTTTRLPRQCTVEKKSGDLDTFIIDKIDIKTPVTVDDCVVKVPAGVHKVEEGK